jgi:hypothetical protein
MFASVFIETKDENLVLADGRLLAASFPLLMDLYL